MASFRNDLTGDVLDVPPPNYLGEGVVRLNGVVVERVLYSDESESVTMEDGKQFSSQGWAKHIVECLRIGKWTH
jgi:hypothetical protein